ncbi:hypothetical protein ACLOJK_038533 [Asimina triloba]
MDAGMVAIAAGVFLDTDGQMLLPAEMDVATEAGSVRDRSIDAISRDCRIARARAECLATVGYSGRALPSAWEIIALSEDFDDFVASEEISDHPCPDPLASPTSCIPDNLHLRRPVSPTMFVPDHLRPHPHASPMTYVPDHNPASSLSEEIAELNQLLHNEICLRKAAEDKSGSAIYAAFGSLTILDRGQFQELALGLEQSGHPFLWVALSDLTDDSSAAYPEGFEARVADHGRIVSWSPQQKVLSHPSIACFLTHRGWNSTLEGLSYGVPFLCWPYFAGQFLNRTTITDAWKVGSGLEANPCGIIPREEIKKKLEELIDDEGIKARCLEFQEMARKCVCEGGSLSKNLAEFMEEMKSKAENTKTK